MNMNRTLLRYCAVIVMIAACSHTMFSQNTFVHSSSLDMGYGAPAALNVAARSIIGQSFVGASFNANTTVESGFLADTLFRITIVSVVPERGGFPKAYSLSQNYPNPFNPVTVIRFQIAHSGSVKLQVFDVLGRVVATLVDDLKGPGSYAASWDAGNVASGMYVYRLAAGNFVQVRKLMVMK